MDKVKICHMTSVHAPEDVRIFHKECVSLAQAGYEVYLVERGESYDKNGVHIVGVGEAPKSRWKRMTGVARCVYEKALDLDCDIYHFHDPELLPYGLKLKRKGKKVIFDIHENTAGAIREKKYIPSPLRIMLSWSYEKYEAAIGKALDALITVTPTQTNFYKRINDNTVEVANFPVFKNCYKKSDFSRKAAVFAGGITPQWNHDKIIFAISNIHDAEYVLCGSDNVYVESLKALPGWRTVDFRGAVAHEQVLEIMSSCTVGVALLQPGRNTAGKIGTMGNTKIFEEMMAGLPIVCTDFELWRSFVDEYHCGIYVDPDNEDAIAAAFRYLFEHLEEARRMGENGLRAIKERFNWELEQKKLFDLYEKLLELHP